MRTIWGHLEKVDELLACPQHILVRTFLPGGIAIRVRANIVAQTLIARGTDAVDVSDLREGEFVEVSYRQGKEGRLNAVKIYVRPEQTVGDLL
jgi:hypothetical protein